MHFSMLLPYVLAPFAAAAPAEMVPVAPLVTLYHNYDWAGPQFEVRSLSTCVKVTGPVREHARSAKLWPNSPPDRICALFGSNNCRPGTEVVFITARNSKVNIQRDSDVRSVRCEGMRD
ncbi:hypothetical protein GGI43DRAFT_240068 [Trichoderma evansii]